MSGTVDPRVYDLAETFVEDVIKDAWTKRNRGAHVIINRLQLVARLAIALQQAIEDETKAIRQELGIES